MAKLYAQVDWVITFTRALSVNSYEADAKARTILARIQGESLADVHIIRSWLALSKFQKKQAIIEAELALELEPNSVDAMEVLAMAKIYAGFPESGIALAKRVIRQNPTLLSRPLMLIGLAEFVLGNSESAVENIKRSFELGSQEIRYAGVLAAAYAELGLLTDAKEALEEFRRSTSLSLDLADAMVLFPFTNPDVLHRLAKGLEVSGIKVWYSVQDGGYMPLAESNKLNGTEIESLFSGSMIEGKRFWGQPASWGRRQSENGEVIYTGFGIQSGVQKSTIGTSRIVDDMLCEEWPGDSGPLKLCSLIFRLPEGNSRTRWGEYVLVTDTGPNSFNVTR